MRLFDLKKHKRRRMGLYNVGGERHSTLAGAQTRFNKFWFLGKKPKIDIDRVYK